MKRISGGITAPRGYKSSGIKCGLKKSNNKDLALVFSEKKAQTAGVFTSNEVKAAPVILSQSRLQQNPDARAVVINSGNANACTGQQGLDDARDITALVAEELDILPEEVLTASTGIIGKPLPVDKIKAAVPKLISELSFSGKQAAEAIMTTDTFIKETAYNAELPVSGSEVTLGGMAKGSGMICPDMATMLSVLTSDVVIEQELLCEAFQEAVDFSFNRISVDGDQSTNDCVFLMSNQLSNNQPIQTKNEDYKLFCKMLKKAASDLARDIVADGEGATKFITIQVKKSPTPGQARRVARQVANSNLVKTACFGSDPNWGRILAAAGAGASGIDPQITEVSINGVKLFAHGLPAKKSRGELGGLMDAENIDIEIILNQGSHSAEYWTSDLSYKYIEINAEYHT